MILAAAQLLDSTVDDFRLSAAVETALRTLTPADEVAVRVEFGFEARPEFEDIRPSEDWRSAVQKLRVNAYAVLSPWSPDV